jgi:hypothetical protein
MVPLDDPMNHPYLEHRAMAKQISAWSHLLASILVVLSFAQGAVAAEPTREELEKKFSEELSGAVLVGRFTIEGESGEGKGREERYAIKRVTKVAGDTWLFESTVEYGGKAAVTVPIPLQMKWAGDTPVITLTKLTIPLLGTYTARVLFYDGQYAGTWSGADHGGQMFGRVTHPEEDQSAENDQPEEDDNDGK